MAKRIGGLIGLVVLSLGCQAAEEPTVDQHQAYVLLDESARLAGFEIVQGDWVGGPRLPASFDGQEATHLRSPRGEVRDLDPTSGDLAHVQGAGGRVEWYVLGEDVAEDRLVARGDERAIRTLADMLAAEVEGQAGDFVLVSEDIWERAAFLEPPEGIDEVAPDFAVGDAPVKLSVLTDNPSELAPIQADNNGAGNADIDILAPTMVGAYMTDSDLLILDASGGFTLQMSCSPAVHGRFLVEVGKVSLVSDDGQSYEFSVENGRLSSLGRVWTSLGDQ